MANRDEPHDLALQITEDLVTIPSAGVSMVVTDTASPEPSAGATNTTEVPRVSMSAV